MVQRGILDGTAVVDFVASGVIDPEGTIAAIPYAAIEAEAAVPATARRLRVALLRREQVRPSTHVGDHSPRRRCRPAGWIC